MHFGMDIYKAIIYNINDILISVQPFTSYTGIITLKYFFENAVFVAIIVVSNCRIQNNNCRIFSKCFISKLCSISKSNNIVMQQIKEPIH